MSVLSTDLNVLGLAVGGSWITGEMDEYSDLDLVLVTREKLAGDRGRMTDYAKKLGHYLSGFTGEHVGEPRVLICLFDHPLLHVDIKFVTTEEFANRVEDPFILFDRHGELHSILEATEARFPYPDFQWIEDRFWTWVHYALLKIGRGEYLEAFDFSGYLRMVVLGPLLHIRNGNLPRAVRRVETDLSNEDLNSIIKTIPAYDRASLIQSLESSVNLYRSLRDELFTETVEHQKLTEQKVMEYFALIQNNNSSSPQ